MYSEKQYSEISYPASRQFTFDVGRIGISKHHVKALLEVDVTESRKIQTGYGLEQDLRKE